MGILNRNSSELRLKYFRSLVMKWLQWILQHPQEIYQFIKLGIEITHKLFIKRRTKRLNQEKAKEEEERIKVYRYSGKTNPG
jgi:hypothetical protein